MYSPGKLGLVRVHGNYMYMYLHTTTCTQRNASDRVLADGSNWQGARYSACATGALCTRTIQLIIYSGPFGVLVLFLTREAQTCALLKICRIIVHDADPADS